MATPPSDDPLSSSDFASEFLPAVNFGESFGFNGCFDFDDFGEGGSVFSASNSLSYGGYEDISCLMSIESHVRLRHCHPGKKRCPNRLYRKDSIKSSSWYRNFLRPGLTHYLTHELSISDHFGEFRSLF